MQTQGNNATDRGTSSNGHVLSNDHPDHACFLFLKDPSYSWDKSVAARVDAGVRVPETQDPESQKGSQTPASLSDDQVNDLKALLAEVLKEAASSEYGEILNTCLKDGRDLTAEERVNIEKYLDRSRAQACATW